MGGINRLINNKRLCMGLKIAFMNGLLMDISKHNSNNEEISRIMGQKIV